MIQGIGTFLGFSYLSIGCLTRPKVDRGRCRAMGALGGLIVTIPGTLALLAIVFTYRFMYKRGHRLRASLLLFTLIPALCVGFGVGSGLAGWVSLRHVYSGGLGFEMHDVIIMAVIGSGSTAILVSLALWCIVTPATGTT